MSKQALESMYDRYEDDSNKVHMSMTVPHFAKSVERQKIALELRQQGKRYSEIAEYMIEENPELLTRRYTPMAARQDVVQALASIADDIGKMADKFVAAELIRLDQQESETTDMLEVMTDRINDKLETGVSIESSLDRWTKLQELRLKISDQRMKFIRDAMPKVSISEERTVMSVDDFNDARQKVKNIVTVNKKYDGSLPPPMSQPEDVKNTATIFDEEDSDEEE